MTRKSINDNYVRDSRSTHDEDECSEAFNDEHSCSGSGGGQSNSSNSSGKGRLRNITKKSFQLAKRETQAVGGLRGFVILVLLLSTIGVALAVYYYTSGQEQAAFETRFEDDANKVIQGIAASIRSTLAGADAFAVEMVSNARTANQTWPFVYFDDFGVRAEKFRAMTNALYLSLYMIVENQTMRHDWEAYTAKEGPRWVEHSMEMQKRENMFQDVLADFNVTNITYWDVVWGYDEFDKALEEMGVVGVDPIAEGPFMPNWQTSPVITDGSFSPYNWDLMDMLSVDSPMSVLNTHKVAIGEAYQIMDPEDPELTAQAIDDTEWSELYMTSGEEAMEPMSDIYYPIIVDEAADWINVFDQENYDPSEHQVGAILAVAFFWRDMIKDILPDGSDGVVVAFESPCNPTFAYEINGPTYKFLGAGSTFIPEKAYTYLERAAELRTMLTESKKSSYSGVPLNEDICPFTIRVSPSAYYESFFITKHPAIYTSCAVAIFIFTAVVFICYDYAVERRQKVVMRSAVRSDAIVSSLFPGTVKDRLYTSQASVQEEKRRVVKESLSITNIADADATQNSTAKSLPIADLFPEATVVFADIAGFTAWSSTREPTQVFVLLESLYGSFDRIAKRRGVFKVETIGDCYVAVVGLPKPRRNHAIVMARFAADIRESMNTLTRELELQLGPGTNNLTLRVGLHSGPVTAGVLRGEKSRFQLFGDTMNTTARVETTGTPNKIHCSQKTADLLIEAGKEQWLTKRDTPVEAKGKGKMQTYWVEPGNGLGSSCHSESNYTESSSGDENSVQDSLMSDFEKEIGIDYGGKQLSESVKTLVDWNAMVLEDLLRKLIAHRRAMGHPENGFNICWQPNEESTVRDEVVKSINLPPFQKVPQTINPDSIILPDEVSEQLRNFVLTIASKYHSNSFHNFEHASHVTTSVSKLLRRITNMSKTLSQQEVYIHSFGIALDPLGQLALTFAALVHDVDHQGVPNFQLIKEDVEMAARYKNKSIAEQNSVDLAWFILMEDSYKALRDQLFTSTSDMNRFRQFLVNFVMATDIFDPDLKAMRNQRWELAFSDSAHSEDPDALNRKATIVLEHVIQASDVCHTMQHWHIYQRWNSNLFREMYGAYKAGRSDKDPTNGWYDGELWFFDNYIIPLAEKLKECQVFGASSHEFLDFAYDNRLEWEHKGKVIVEEMREALEKECRVDV